MNLLNKKLNDKLKLIDEIDKEYMLKAKNNNNDDKTNNNMNSMKIIKNSQIENFDKIYSNFSDEKIISFYDGSINLKKFSNSNNNCDKVPTNENSLEKEKNEYCIIQEELNKEIYEVKNKNKNKNNSINNNNENGNKNENENDNEIKKDNVKEELKNNDYYYNVDVAVRLMNYGNYLKQKIENERERQYLKMKQRMKPEISHKSKSITRNSEKASKNNINNNKNLKDNSANNNSSYISNSNPNFTYHPKLNKKSLLLAKKCEPSFIRLNKKKKIKIEKEEDKQPKSYYLNLYGNKDKTKKINKTHILSLSNNNNINKSHNNIYEKMNDLYLRGIKLRHKKEQNIKEIQKLKEEEYKKYSYKPKLNKNNSYVNNNKTCKSKKSIYIKHFEWRKKVQNELNKKKVRREEFINKLCTFKPQLYKPNYNDNDKSLSKALDQINYYINRKKENLKHKNNEEIYKNKKLGIDLQGYIIKSTIPKEFNLQTEKRNNDLNKNRNRSCDNFHINKINKLIEQNSESKSLSNENDKKFWFIKDDINDTNGYNFDDNSNNNSKVSQSKIHINFDEAVNFLHDKLNNLNI